MVEANKRAHTKRENGTRQRSMTLALIGVGALIFILANVHLLYVAIGSQPDCVPHSKVPGQVPEAYRAAKSAC